MEPGRGETGASCVEPVRELIGTFEARPTAYSGRSLTGSFEATRS